MIGRKPERKGDRGVEMCKSERFSVISTPRSSGRFVMRGVCMNIPKDYRVCYEYLSAWFDGEFYAELFSDTENPQAGRSINR